MKYILEAVGTSRFFSSFKLKQMFVISMACILRSQDFILYFANKIFFRI